MLVDDAFAGSLDDLRAARAATGLPLLAKGFFSTEEHLREVREAGADAALLILRDLDDATAAQLMRAAEELGLDTLVEAHDEEELERATRLGARVIGVNARDLGTFRIDRAAQLELVAKAPRDRVVVAESAIHTRAQAAAAELAGADAVLVGTSLMRAAEPGAKLRELLSRPLVKVCGLTRQEDVDAAVEAGADLCGFIFAEGSPRRATGVLDGARHGAQRRRLRRRARGARRGPRPALRARGGHGARPRRRPAPRRRAGRARRRPARGRARIPTTGATQRGDGPPRARRPARARQRARGDRAVHPWAVDAASQLESAPGIKDHEKVRAFVQEARA